jgi:hypothetical protein
MPKLQTTVQIDCVVQIIITVLASGVASACCCCLLRLLSSSVVSVSRQSPGPITCNRVAVQPSNDARLRGRRGRRGLRLPPEREVSGREGAEARAQREPGGAGRLRARQAAAPPPLGGIPPTLARAAQQAPQLGSKEWWSTR